MANLAGQEHLYTLHHTYTGQGCAHCGKEADSPEHTPGVWMVDGEKKEQEQRHG